MLYQYTCPRCNKEFSARARNRKYCSRKCSDKGRRVLPKTCLQCGKKFHPNKTERKYCSRKCSAETQRRTRICPQCGKEFFPGKENSRYCSHQCAKKSRFHPPRICAQCGKEFNLSNSKRGKYCSRECSAKSQRNIRKNCAHCGQTIVSSDSTRKFCDAACYFASKYPGWEPGLPRRTRYYGRNWNAQRIHAIIRDNYTCQRCHVILDSPNINVHHKTPFDSFNKDWLSANKLDNLISLCRSCHTKVEKGAPIILS